MSFVKHDLEPRTRLKVGAVSPSLRNIKPKSESSKSWSTNTEKCQDIDSKWEQGKRWQQWNGWKCRWCIWQWCHCLWGRWWLKWLSFLHEEDANKRLNATRSGRAITRRSEIDFYLDRLPLQNQRPYLLKKVFEEIQMVLLKSNLSPSLPPPPLTKNERSLNQFLSSLNACAQSNEAAVVSLSGCSWLPRFLSYAS